MIQALPFLGVALLASLGGYAVVKRKIEAAMPVALPETSEIARRGDEQFYVDLVHVSRTDRDLWIRAKAWLAARTFKERWLDRPDRVGHAVGEGCFLPLYGNYCGVNYTGTAEPIDAIDAACRSHDRARAATFG